VRTSRKNSGVRKKKGNNLLKSTFSEDPHRNKKIHSRFTSGNRDIEDSGSSQSISESYSGSDEDLFENIHNFGSEIREKGI